MDRFTLLDFEGSVEDVIAMLLKLPAGSRLEWSSEIQRSGRIGGDPEEVEFLIVKEA
jgi:hypothetical protein